MNKIKKIMLGITLLLLLGSIYFYYQYTLSQALPKDFTAKNVEAGSAKVLDAVSAAAQSKPFNGSAEMLLKPGIKQQKRSIAVDELYTDKPMPDSLDVIEKSDVWLKKANQGDASAALALARAAQNCQSDEPTVKRLSDGRLESSSTRCGGMPAGYRDKVLDWTEIAAKQGDLRAEVEYGLQLLAKPVSTYQSPEKAQNRERQNSSAISYLEDAASYGVQEAYLTLFQGYSNGSFGVRDPVKAYAYLLSLGQISGSNDFDTMIAAQGKLLRTYDLEQARNLAVQIVSRCCKSITSR